MLRELILDIESTGFYTNEGHRMTEIGIVEMIDGELTGKSFHAYLNPEREVPEEIVKITGLTDKFLSDKPLFSEIAQELKDFIGDDIIIITCWDMDGYVLDTAMLNMELKKTGLDETSKHQWCNIRKWSEELYGHEEARLDNVLKRFNIDKTEREEKGHGALLDAQLLAKVYPKIKQAYFEHIANEKIFDIPAEQRAKKKGQPKL